MLIKKALDNYIADLKGCSDSTKITYHNRLINQPKSFLNYCIKENIKDVKKIDYPFLEKYRSYIQKSHNAYSVRGMVSALKGFLKYSYKKEWNAINGSKFKNFGMPAREKVTISSDIISNALHNPVGKSSFAIARNNFIMAAFGYLGLEPSELQRLKITDIKPFEDTGRMELYSRKGIKRSVIIDSVTWSIFLEYLKERSSFITLKKWPDHGFLLFNNRGDFLSASGIENVIRKLKKDLIKKGIMASDIEFNPSSLKNSAKVEKSENTLSTKQLFYIEKRLEHILDNSIVIQTKPYGIRSNMDKVEKLIEQNKKVDPHIKFWWAIYPIIVDSPISDKVQPLFYCKEGELLNEEPLTLYGFKDQLLYVTDKVIPKNQHKKVIVQDGTMRERVRAARLNKKN